MRVNIIQNCFDLIWPRVCEICGKEVEEPARHICASCLMRIPFVPQVGCCSICGRPVIGLECDYLCEDCANAPTRPAFDRAGSVFRFEGDARQIVLDYKFNRHLWMCDDLVSWLFAALNVRFNVPAIDLVLPMPSTLFHRIDRGYNQCAYLAKPLARLIERKYDDTILRRKGHPKRQSNLTAEERRKNAIGTFRVQHPERIRGRTVLVVDDVMTTGSTLSECAKELKAAGAYRVWCITLARSIRD